MIVADANAIIYLVRDTSFTALARQAYAQDSHWIAPPLWKPEVLNGLLSEVRAGHLNLSDAIEAANAASLIVGNRTHECDAAAVLRTAEESRLTAYDAYYVALARSLGVLLVTEDSRIKKNCPDVARSLKAFLGLPEELSRVPGPRWRGRAARL